MNFHPLYSSLVFAVLLVAPFESCQERSVAPKPFKMARGPEDLVHAIAFSYESRSLAAYRDLMTDDFMMVCAEADSAGNVSQGATHTREDELLRFAALADPYREPPFRELTLEFGEPIVTTAGTRPGHRVIRTTYLMQYAEGSEQTRSLTGEVQFFIVRGDSASLPPLGDQPDDPRVWYLERWEDLTTGDGWCAFPARNPIP